VVQIDRHSADIIPFPLAAIPQPAGPDAPAPETLPDEAEDPIIRLRRALAMLQNAQAEQLRAVSDWRASLSDLSATASDLQVSLRNYWETLETFPQP
jgi:hypothetical protein